MKRWFELIAQFTPMVLGALNVNPEIVAVTAGGLATAEAALGAGTGPEKKVVVLAGVGATVQALNQARAGAGKPPVGDPAVIQGELSSGIDLVVQIVNAIHASEAPKS